MNPMSITDNLIEKTITFFRTKLDENFFNQNEEALIKYATYATPAAAAVGLLIAIVAAVKMDSLAIFFSGLGWVVLVAICYFIGSRFLNSCKSIINNNTSTISNPEFLNASGLIMILALIATVIGGLYFAIKTSEISILYWITPLAISLLYFINLLLNPQLISTKISESATAGEDAIAILVVQFKAAVKLAGIVFGSMTIIGSIFLVFSLFNIFKEDALYYGITDFIGGSYLVISGLLYPFFIYIAFAFFYLFADLCKAILTLHKR